MIHLVAGWLGSWLISYNTLMKTFEKPMGEMNGRNTSETGAADKLDGH